MDRESVIRVAQTYLINGLVEHKGSEVLFAPDATRVENGVGSGSSGQEIAKGLSSGGYRTIQGIKNMKWIVDGEHSICFFELHTEGPEPVYIAEYFRVADDGIKEIEATFHVDWPQGD